MVANSKKANETHCDFYFKKSILCTTLAHLVNLADHRFKMGSMIRDMGHLIKFLQLGFKISVFFATTITQLKHFVTASIMHCIL